MSLPRPSFAVLFGLVFIIMVSICHGNRSVVCPMLEVQTLLTLKHSLNDFYKRLISWNEEIDCCKWDGVVCNNLTGHVRELDLSGYALSGTLPSLFNLKYLTYLDLSRNDFSGPIPSFIGSFTSLQYLNLSSAGFYGSIPHIIGNLSNLRTLDLGLMLNADSLDWLSNLHRLEDLNIVDVNLSRASNWAQVINTLPSLFSFRLDSCSLGFTLPVFNNNVSTTLTAFALTGNYFKFPAVPIWVFRMSSLVSLDLSWNYFEGSIPTISNTTKLRYIDLSHNRFDSSIPDWLYLCKDLEFVNLKRNGLQNKVSNDINNLTLLKTLNLYFNRLSGSIPSFLGNLSNLEYLDLSDNQFSGALPTGLGKLSNLAYLDVKENKLIDHLPNDMGQIFNLTHFYCGGNMLTGIVTSTHFANLTRLKVFDASRNHLSIMVPPNWVPPFNLRVLKLGSWSVGTSIPSWIHTQMSITQLDLSRTGISGIVPTWFWKMSFLDLSHNKLHGTMPNLLPHDNSSSYDPSTSSSFYLNSNRFHGPLPRVTSSVWELDLSNNSFSGDLSPFVCGINTETSMTLLNLGDNELSGVLPDCWMNWTSLMVLSLKNNYISGVIPESIGLLSPLQYLDVYNNNLHGRIPVSLLNCTSLVKVDLSQNELEGSIPTGMGISLVNLVVLILRSNKLTGEVLSDICYLNSLQILDLSDNNFSGRLPTCVGNFTAMAKQISLEEKGWSRFSFSTFVESAYVSTKGRELLYDTLLSLVTNIDFSKNNFFGDIPKELTSLVELKSLNLSENRLTGPIPYSIGNMKQLESLDLSRNSLSGEIPNSITVLSFLSYVNMSYNNLSGRIPESTQLGGQDPSSFVGNNLCGPPLMSSCSNGGDPSVPYEEDDKWLCMFVSLGYGVGLFGVLSPLVLTSWREAYFGLLEDVWAKIYVYFYIRWARFGRRREWNS